MGKNNVKTFRQLYFKRLGVEYNEIKELSKALNVSYAVCQMLCDRGYDRDRNIIRKLVRVPDSEAAGIY